MQRRSKRLRTAPQPDYGPDSDDDTPDSLDASFKSTSRAKSKNSTVSTIDKGKRTVRGRRGQLETVFQLPLDVLFEIFAQLTPLDLLNLSRTSKSLRDILIRRSSQYMWKSARAQVEGLPDCPNDMSEPAYANLVFYPYCQFCFKTYVSPKSILWNLRTKACKPCLKTHFKPLPDDLPQGIIPSCLLSVNSNRLENVSTIDTMRHYAAAITELKDSEVTEWIAAKRSEYEIVKAHATRCEVWITNRNFNRSNELDTFRTQRYEAIKEKLVDLGWKMEIERLAKEFWHDEPVKLVNHKLVKQPKPLTERIWTNIKDTLIQFMVDYKVRRLVREYKLMIRKRGIVLAKVMEEYAASQPLHDIFPPMLDIASLLAFRVIIEDTPAEEEVTQDHFQGPMADYPMIAMEWRKAKDELLVKLINDHPDTTGNATLVTLRYAKTFFHCNNCGEPISYPRILVHRCNTKLGRFSTVDPDLDKYFEYLEERPWNHQGRVIKYDHLFSKRAEDILGDCELDLTIRNSDLTEKDLRFECQLCESPNEGRWIMNWPAVMDHIHDSHTFGDSAEKTGFIKQAPFNFDELRLLYILEWLQSCPLSQSYEHYSSWVCRQCKRKVPWSACLEHYAKSHPGIIPDELTSFEHNRSPDRFMALHLDAARSLVGTTIQMNVDNPFHSYRKVLLSYEAFRYSSIGVDELARDMADSLLSPSTEGEDDFSDTEGLLAT